MISTSLLIINLIIARIERKYCFISTAYIWQGQLTFAYYFILDRIVCFGDFSPTRTLCDACHRTDMTRIER